MQFALLGCCFLLGTILRSTFVVKILAHEAWLAAFGGALLSVPIFMLYCALARAYPGMDIFQINEAVFGKWAGRALDALYLLFFLALATVNLNDASGFVSAYLIEGTHTLPIAGAMLAALAYTLRKGMQQVARLAPAALTLAAALLTLSFIQSAPLMDFGRLFPIFRYGAGEYVHAALIVGAIPFGEAFALLTLLPHLSRRRLPHMDEPEKAQPIRLGRPLGMLFAATFFIVLAVHVRETAVLGPLLGYTSLPGFEVMRVASADASMARTESIYEILMVLMLCVKITVIDYAVVSAFAAMAGQTDKRPFILPCGLLLAFSMAAYRQSEYNHVLYILEVAPFVWLAFEFALPGLTWLAGLLKRPHGHPNGTKPKEARA